MKRHRPLVATYFTLAGEVRPLEGSIVSPHAFRTRAEAAGRAGYEGFGFAQEDLDAILRVHDYREIAAILADNGLVHNEIEVLMDWFCDGPRGEASGRVRRAMLTSAEKLGLRHIKAGVDLAGGHWPLAHMAERFAALADAAREAGTSVCIELFPESNIADLETGMAIVTAAGRSNAGLLLDVWHMVRGGVAFADIARLPEGAILHVELDDGKLTRVGSILEDTIDRRKLCGEGEFDLLAFLQSIEATHYKGAYGVEVLSHEQRARSPEEAARRSCETARACLDRLDRSSPASASPAPASRDAREPRRPA